LKVGKIIGLVLLQKNQFDYYSKENIIFLVVVIRKLKFIENAVISDDVRIIIFNNSLNY